MKLSSTAQWVKYTILNIQVIFFEKKLKTGQIKHCINENIFTKSSHNKLTLNNDNILQLWIHTHTHKIFY